MQMPEIDLVDLAQTVSRQRRLFFSVIAGFALVTLVALHFVTPKYTETMTIAPVTDSNSQLGGGLSALANLGGVNLNSGGGQGQFQFFLGAITSRKTADALAQDQELMRHVFADNWNAGEQRWNQPSGVLHAMIGAVKFVLGSPVQPWHAPNGEDVQKILEDQVQVDTDDKNPTVKLSMQTDRPEVAREFLTKLVLTVDGHLRARALERANNYIAYLTKEFETVTVADYRAALTGHLTEQEQIRMMASAGNVAFAAQTFSPPSRSAQPTAPKRTLVLLFAILVGAGVGGWAAVRADRRQSRMPKLAMQGRGMPHSIPAD